MPKIPLNSTVTGRLGEYQIVHPLGAGGFGQVYKGKAISGDYSGKDVAIKYPISRDERAIRYISIEIQFLKKVRHPNIVSYFDDGVYKSLPFLVMEYIEGEDLYNVVRDYGKKSLEEAIKIMSILSDVVQYIHSLDYIHRDFNPRNVLITRDNNIKIIDFGTLKKGYQGVDRKYNVSGLCFPDFGDPVLYYEEEASAQTDIFTLGSILYYLLTGRPVYTFDKYKSLKKEEALNKIEEEISTNLSTIKDERTRRILEKALLTREYKTAIEFKNDLLGKTAPKPAIDYDAYLVFAGRKYYFKDSLIIGRVSTKFGIPYVALIYPNNTCETLCEDVGPYVSSYDPPRSKYGFARIYRSSGKWYVEKISPHSNKLGVFRKRDQRWYLLDQGMKIEIEDGDILGVPYNPMKGPYKEFIFGVR